MVRINMNFHEIKHNGLYFPPGQYLAKLIEVEEQYSESLGQTRLAWYWEFLEKEWKGVEIPSFTSLQPYDRDALDNHLRAFGFEEKELVDIDTLIGREAVVVVGTGKWGEYGRKPPIVDGILPVEAWHAKPNR